MDYRYRLGSFGDSSSVSLFPGVATPGDCRADPQLGHRGFFSSPAVLLFIFTVFYVPPSSVSLPDFNLTVPLRKYSGEYSCMSSAFSVAILNETSFFLSPGIDFGLDVECY